MVDDRRVDAVRSPSDVVLPRGGRRRVRGACAGAAIVLIAAGCRTPPAVRVSDPLVFTTPLLKQVADKTKPADISADLARYFRTTPAAYKKQMRRQEEMLDATQRNSAYLDIVKTLLTLQLTATLNKMGPGAGPDGKIELSDESKKKPGQTTLGESQKKPLIDAMVKALTESKEIKDSPFDVLDRVADWNTAYMIKLLRRWGDSRSLAISLESKEAIPLPGQERMILLVFQAHVDPGTRPNVSTGVRIRFTGATRKAGERLEGDALRQAGIIKVVRLHPARAYDVDNVGYAESVIRGMSAKVAATAPTQVGDFSLDAARQAIEEADASTKFFSRITKTASFADAGRGEFGWNFYPSNLEVRKTGFLRRVFGWTIGTPQQFDITARLEGGARDCSAFIVVPADLVSFTCEVRGIEDRVPATDPAIFCVPLPPWNGAEAEVIKLPFMRGMDEEDENPLTVDPIEDKAGKSWYRISYNRKLTDEDKVNLFFQGEGRKAVADKTRDEIRSKIKAAYGCLFVPMEALDPQTVDVIILMAGRREIPFDATAEKSQGPDDK